MRLEAFSDAVIAIIMTIMVLEFEVPHGSEFDALRPLFGSFLVYALSFVFLGIYWNNHHHLMVVVERVTGGIMWANLHLLFWLSLAPFVTKWMGQNGFAPIPTATYGVVLFLAAVAFRILQKRILAEHETDEAVTKAVESGVKEFVSIGLYASGIAVAFFVPLASLGIYVLVAFIWIVPDRRIERVIKDEQAA